MAYRDDKETMKQRIATLESELSTAQQTIARLMGQIDERASDEMADLLTKEQLRITRELDLALSDAGVEAIAEMLRERLPNCQLSEIGRTLTCRWGTAELRVIRRAGNTEIKLSANDPRSKAFLALGGFGLSVLGGPVIVGLAAALGAPPLSAVVLVPLILIGGYLLMDKLTKVNLRRARTTLRGVLESTIELAKEHAQRRPARIDVGAASALDAEAKAAPDAEADAAAEAEAEAAAEASLASHAER